MHHFTFSVLIILSAGREKTFFFLLSLALPISKVFAGKEIQTHCTALVISMTKESMTVCIYSVPII